MKTEIRREIILKADPKTVWQRSFATREAILSWFAEGLNGNFVLGGCFNLIWGEHVCECRLTAYDPPRTLAYQWHPGDNVPLTHYPENELTTVTFALEPHESGTKLTLTETGFENIPATRTERVFAENEGGWTYELNELQAQYGN